MEADGNGADDVAEDDVDGTPSGKAEGELNEEVERLCGDWFGRSDAIIEAEEGIWAKRLKEFSGEEAVGAMEGGRKDGCCCVWDAEADEAAANWAAIEWKGNAEILKLQKRRMITIGTPAESIVANESICG